ncbi:hypothetical protein C8Q75DRAFT_808345 [Abortiporus biennis]|nr:hypothetical protein C8Q75DRAFT_808345 [Abortiporus biennis]
MRSFLSIRTAWHRYSPRRPYSTSGELPTPPTPPPKQPSPHAQFYSDLVPAMIPIALLGSAVYLGLKLAQTNLSNEKYLDEARGTIKRLEDELDQLRSQQQPQIIPSSSSPLSAVSSSSSGASKKWWFW